MAKALQPEVRADRVTFELDRFDPGAGGRIELSGRWFGVRGRRFMRPTLTLYTDAGSFRALADLEHKPWAPEEGDAWEAAFPWDGEAEVIEAELAVAPGISIVLPRPADARKARTPAHGRARTGARPAGRDGLAELREKLAGAEREVERLRRQVDALRAEGEATLATSAEETAALQSAKLEAEAALARRDAALASAEDAHAARDAALASRDEMLAARDAAIASRDEALAAREQALAMGRGANAELDQVQQALEAAIRERDEAVSSFESLAGERAALVQAGERLQYERDEAISARGAALVMRNATRAGDDFERHAGWFQRAIAVVVLVFAVFALLIVLHLL